MKEHGWVRDDWADGATTWICLRCGTVLESDQRPREQESGDGILMVYGPFDSGWRDVSTSSDCEEELVRRVMES